MIGTNHIILEALGYLRRNICFYLQSDIVHQSVYELVHSEDREELQRQLMWNSFLPPESANIGLQDVLLPENCHLLERSFTVRFRCLLDNTSGFLVIIIYNSRTSKKIQTYYSQN